MKGNFDVKEYIRILGNELVSEFDKAGMTTHPHSVSSGRENSARIKLKNILPAGIGVGSGFVIDSYGNTSQQCDIILYEETLSLKFIINEDQANAYYNCESVIAVGEVKSIAGTKEINDAIGKLKRIKQLKRYNDDGHNCRNYFSSTTIRDSIDDGKINYNSDNDTLKQIYTFLLCQDLNVITSKIIKDMEKQCDRECEYINRIFSTKGAYISYLDNQCSPAQIKLGKIGANMAFNLIDNPYAFNYFINDLVNFINHASTVPLNYERYLSLPMRLEDLKETVNL